jgi:8-oxo-dGTP diphosphatase
MSYTYEYPRPAVTVDAAVFRYNENVLEVLLIERGNYPFEGMWALPGGFLDMDETLEAAVVRELEEETGLKSIDLKQLHAYSAIGRDPRGRTITITFYGMVDFENSKVTAGDDARNANWFPVEKIDKLAFDHQEMIEMALQKIQ